MSLSWTGFLEAMDRRAPVGSTKRKLIQLLSIILVFEGFSVLFLSSKFGYALGVASIALGVMLIVIFPPSISKKAERKEEKPPVGPEPVGIDVESVRPLSKMMRIAARFFSEKERSYLETKPEHQRLEAFFDLWTLKESYIKAVGTGLSRPLKSFSVVPTDDDSATLESERDEAFRFFRRYTLLEGYKVAICSREARFPEEIQMIDFTPSEL